MGQTEQQKFFEYEYDYDYEEELNDEGGATLRTISEYSHPTFALWTIW